jgi:hypothetical protein
MMNKRIHGKGANTALSMEDAIGNDSQAISIYQKIERRDPDRSGRRLLVLRTELAK